MVADGAAPGVRAPRRHSCARRAPVTAILCDGEPCRGVALADGTEITAPVVVSACDPRRTFVEWLRHAAGRVPTSLVARWRRPSHRRRVRVEDRRRRRREPPVLRDSDHAACRRRCTIAPTLAEMDRGAPLMAPAGRSSTARRCSSTCRRCSTRRWPRPGATCFSLEVLLTPYRRAGGWPGVDRAAALARAVRRAVRARLPRLDRRLAGDDARRLRARLPPARRATPPASAAGRSPRSAVADPELTRYETAVPGLYLTGAATFPGAGIWGASGRNCATVVLSHRAVRKRPAEVDRSLRQTESSAGG